MQNNIDSIISNALTVNKNNLNREIIQKTIKGIQKAINDNKEAILSANNIDRKNNNGFLIDFELVNNIFKIIENESIYYGDVTLSQKDDKKKILYGKQIYDIGNVIIINDGNTYTILELILRNILAGNTSIICNSGYMYGINQLLIQIIGNVLDSLNLSKYFVQIYAGDDYENVLEKYASIDLVICIGNHEMQQRIISKSKNKTLLSGYENFDIYIESATNMGFIQQINALNVNINYYINSDLNIQHPKAIYVQDIEEAIAQINYNSNKYAAAIFTDNSDNASKFIKKVKTSIVTVNASPTIERILDIHQKDLCLEKTIIYPFNFKFDGESTNINVK